MNDLTSPLIGNEFNLSLNESLKQSRTFDFESGLVQTIGNKSVPSIIVDIAYKNINQTVYDSLEAVYQNNHSNTFLVNLGQDLDIRILYNLPNNGVWAFSNFQFETSAQQTTSSGNLYTGKITIITSVIFNYTEFQGIFNEPSNYTPNMTTDTSFSDVLEIINPRKVIYSYQLNRKFQNLGQSLSTQRDLGNSKRTWKLEFLCQESEWIELITYFRKKGGINPFGMTKEGYFINNSQQLINAQFQRDSFTHQKMIGNLYIVNFEMVEVR